MIRTSHCCFGRAVDGVAWHTRVGDSTPNVDNGTGFAVAEKRDDGLHDADRTDEIGFVLSADDVRPVSLSVKWSSQRGNWGNELAIFDCADKSITGIIDQDVDVGVVDSFLDNFLEI